MTKKRSQLFTADMERLLRDNYSFHGAHGLIRIIKEQCGVELDPNQIYDKASAMGVKGPRRGKPSHARSLKGESPRKRQETLEAKKIAERDAFQEQMMKMPVTRKNT